jgi:transcriptional regulator with XRE-family HTH domain
MGSKIPKPIKLEVIRKWLQGKSRNEIAKEVGIGAGTVSGIIQGFRQNDPEFDLLREAAVKLKNQGINIESFAPFVRLREILNQIEGIDHHHDQAADEKIESLIVNLEVFCFKQNLSIKEFVNLVHDITWVSEILGVPLEKLPGHIKQLENNLHMLTKQIEEKKLEKQNAFEDYGVTINLLEEFKRNKPLFETCREQKLELDKVKQEIESCKKELENEKLWKSKEEQQRWSIPETELDKANRVLGINGSNGSNLVQRLNPGNLKDIVMELYHHPSKYLKAITYMMDIYNLEHR